ncbi:hypothetical protein CcaverHIS002_0406040 [Cutaneotrichosporon cavernicola]|uniref:Vps72/YL1 C-terminal domain-containing protein n=1 Tax=Cutaneotrichosporon cavernicola TaxID=279322 RepID=A0AA48QVY4_9TREE|nr:uncharacterized protein CcaverHIS019_0406060 [Cutaneotrichosporon cavernicola]BEI84000.1 hypothetical protein CcaverHIS002_0406040 [Cutaneotrichosporon cavernicola]BEI91786.1 hypothetical protein CcaverHIS019_0406060 [Cutaneotrichosporon cavernicola]BEI99558.1 hypothetical protein CcaverHIS631_0406010 [Cutaneotrichosporon cavernicola]BEJ07335.1 hypothetical protein CcaverHIS641_0406040 [Cutaneotrichosporon cavernicola]
MKEYKTVTQSRSRRSNAGNRMRELLDKAKQEDQEKDELFAEEADDGEFQEPAPTRDVFLDEFADTDDEAEDEDEDDDARLRREERRANKGKAVFNPFVKIRGPGPSGPQATAAELASLDPSIDVSKMAPSTLMLELRKQRREAKRLHRSDARRSNLRASTLRTEGEVIEREKAEKIALAASKKGRKAQHETGEVRGARPMSQAELIAAALEEEERNKEALTQWLRREEERRELRRVGRKRVRGPRWTFVSRTVGKLVEVVEDTPGVTPGETPAETPTETPAADETPGPSEPVEKDVSKEPGGDKMDVDVVDKPSEAASQSASAPVVAPPADGAASIPAASTPEPGPSVPVATTLESGPSSAPGPASTAGPSQPASSGPSTQPAGPSQPQGVSKPEQSASTTEPVAPPPKTAPSTTTPSPDADPEVPTGPYERNYLILSQVPGGLPAELRLILGDHVDWSDVKVIPARNRPINRKPPTDPLTGLPARYRHPESMVPYASAESYQVLQALLENRYVWTEGGWWGGGEGDVAAEGVEEIPGWKEACVRGWVAGKRVGEEGEMIEVDGEEVEEVEMEGEEGEEVGEEGEAEAEAEGEEEMEEEVEAVVGKGKSKARRSAPKSRSRKKAAPKKSASKAKASAPGTAKKAKSKRRR